MNRFSSPHIPPNGSAKNVLNFQFFDVAGITANSLFYIAWAASVCMLPAPAGPPTFRRQSAD